MNNENASFIPKKHTFPLELNLSELRSRTNFPLARDIDLKRTIKVQTVDK